MITHHIRSVHGLSIDTVAPLDLADQIGAFLLTLPDDRVLDEIDELLEPAIRRMLAVGFPAEDVAAWRDVLADRVLLAYCDGLAP